MTLDRRRFLKLTAAGIVVGAAGSACANDTDRAVDRPQLLDMLGEQKVRDLGARYRADVPSENSAAALRSAIASTEQGFVLPLIGRSIERQVRDDFAAGRTVLVDGWVLSVTEARQCALFSLASA